MRWYSEHELRMMKVLRGPRTKTPIFVMIGPRNEADIIYSTVKHYFNQGAEKVFILDGDSPDNTVEEAKRAGAEVVGILKTEHYDDMLRIKAMMARAKDKSNELGYDKIWWILLNTDEFLEVPTNMTIKEFLNLLNPKFNGVGSFNYNHYPVVEPYYISGYHPIDFQPYYERFPSEVECPHCPEGHWKHMVKLYVKGESFFKTGIGFHGNYGVKEPISLSFIIHHFPYREKEKTYELFASLYKRNIKNDERIMKDRLESGKGDVSGITKRHRNLDCVYGKQWNKVDNLCLKQDRRGVNLSLWKFRNYLYRWYSEGELNKAIMESRKRET